MRRPRAATRGRDEVSPAGLGKRGARGGKAAAAGKGERQHSLHASRGLPACPVPPGSSTRKGRRPPEPSPARNLRAAACVAGPCAGMRPGHCMASLPGHTARDRGVLALRGSTRDASSSSSSSSLVQEASASHRHDLMSRFGAGRPATVSVAHNTPSHGNGRLAGGASDEPSAAAGDSRRPCPPHCPANPWPVPAPKGGPRPPPMARGGRVGQAAGTACTRGPEGSTPPAVSPQSLRCACASSAARPTFPQGAAAPGAFCVQHCLIDFFRRNPVVPHSPGEPPSRLHLHSSGCVPALLRPRLDSSTCVLNFLWLHACICFCHVFACPLQRAPEDRTPLLHEVARAPNAPGRPNKSRPGIPGPVRRPAQRPALRRCPPCPGPPRLQSGPRPEPSLERCSLI